MPIPKPTPPKNWFRIRLEKWQHDIEDLIHQTHVMVLAFKHPRVPWHAKMVAGFSVSYIFSPIQLIPTFIPLIGQMDDLLVLFMGMKLLRRFTPEDVLAECEEEATCRPFLAHPENPIRSEQLQPKQESGMAA
jgi:uncharacterized membrane protein YkvA (DUF1232 family)